MEYLQISEHNKSYIVTIWLKQKKNSFSDYILSRIVVDPDLPIYSSNTIIGTRNYANDTINSINKAYEISKKDWLTSYRDSFLNAVLNSKSKRRFEDGEKEFLKFFNKKYEESLFNALVDNFRPMIDTILMEKINNPDTRCISFSFIRRMTDCIYSSDISGLTMNAHFNKKMSNVFSNSSRLIRNLFAFEFIKSLNLIPVSYIPNGENRPELKGIFEYEYNYDVNYVIIRFKPKESGINSGFVIDIVNKLKSDGQEEVLSSFYVKKYYGSTKPGSKNINVRDSTTFSTSAPISFRASLTSISKKSEWKKRKFDMKEPFLYSLLNSLNFSPEVRFFINPYVIDGFYIATKSLFDSDNTFLPLSEVIVNYNRIYDSLLSESLNQLDLISRFLRLRDLHNNNFGFITYKKTREYKTLTIIDFAQPIFMESYSVESNEIQNSFLSFTYSEQKNEGLRILILNDDNLNEEEKKIKELFLKSKNETVRFLNAFQALQQFQSRLDIARPIDNEEIGEDIDDFQLREILKQKSSEIKSLMLEQRGTDDKPQEVMLRHPLTKLPRTNAELIGFKLGKKPEDYDPYEDQLDYIEDAFEDLDNYCKGIMNNYKTLKRFIIDGYYKYFDEQGNPKIQSVLEE